MSGLMLDQKFWLEPWFTSVLIEKSDGTSLFPVNNFNIWPSWGVYILTCMLSASTPSAHYFLLIVLQEGGYFRA